MDSLKLRTMLTVKAKALKKGDTVGIVSPASFPFEEGDIESAFQWLRKLGLKWKVGDHVTDHYSDMAGSDRDRLADFHKMWADPEVAAIMPVRGGNGAVRLLPHLDFELIKNNPKVIMGFSDVTGLLIPIHQITGLIAFHGPLLCSFYESPYTFNNFQKAVMNTRPIGLVNEPPPGTPWGSQYANSRIPIAQGKARGRLTGGNLTVIRQLMGTPYEIDTEKKIVFLEDVSEEPFSIDRMLTQLLLANKLQQAAAILVGECVNCRPGDSGRRTIPLNHSVERIVRDRLGSLGIPVVYGMHFGHSKEKFILPLGAYASLEVTADGARLEIEEGGVA
jgi:muramoyltetrapeptide carboxypeptidase